MTHSFSSKLEEIPSSGIRKFFDLVIGAKDIISLGVGEPDFSTPQLIRNKAIESLEQGLTSYTSNQGLLELRSSISNYLNTRFSTPYSHESEITITAGVSQAVDIAIRTLTNPGDEFILPVPNYVCYEPLIHLAGGVTVPVNTSGTEFIPDPNAIAKAITQKTKAIILCSPNNPTGKVIPKSVLEAIAKLAEKHNLWVISDEIYAELVFDEPYCSFASLPGMKERTILLSGFSKAFAMTGWRLGYICGPEALISRCVKILQYAQLCAPITAQSAAITALDKGLPDVEEMKRSYKLRRNLFVKRCNELELPLSYPSGAFYGFPSIKRTGLSSEEFALRLLEEKKVAVVPGTAFGPHGESFIRCCFTVDLEQLKEALSRIEDFLKTI